FAALHDIRGVRKTELERSIWPVPGVAAGMVKMEMGVDHERDVARRDTDLSEPIFEQRLAVRALVLDAVYVLELCVLLVPRAGVDENGSGRMLDEETPHSELYAIALVGRDAPFPERF